MGGLMSISGLASGLKTDEILEKLEAVERAPIKRMQQQKTTLQATNKAWADAGTRLLAIKEKAAALAALGQQPAMVASASENITLTTDSSAIAGNYTVTINSLSTYHQIASKKVYADTDTTLVGAGTITLTSNGESKTIATDNMTLEDLRNAINASDIGVKAVIVSTGGAVPQYRMMLSSQTLGEAGAITVDSLVDGWDAANIATMVVASDTDVTVGTGADSFHVKRVGNLLNDIVPGVSFTATTSLVGKEISIAVAQDTGYISKAIGEFANQYNAFIDFVKQMTSFDSKTGATGALFGDFKLTQIVNDLSFNLTKPIANLPDSMHTILQAGMTTDSSGKLVVDSLKLSDLLKEDADAIVKLFTAVGTTNDSAVTYIGKTDDTQASPAEGYAIHVTQAATQGRLTIGTVVPDTLAIDETLVVGTSTITLTAGMTRQQVVERLNSFTTSNGMLASLTQADGTGTGNFLTLSNRDFGSARHVTVLSNVAKGGGGLEIGTTALLDSAPGDGNTGVVGQDVSGTINGQAATGSGQLLTSTAGPSKGLALRITGAQSNQDYGTAVFTRGMGAVLDRLLHFVTDSSIGSIQNTQATLQKQMDDLDDRIATVNASVDREIKRMRDMFNAMEVKMSVLQNQAAQLASQIRSLPSYSSGSDSE